MRVSARKVGKEKTILFCVHGLEKLTPATHQGYEMKGGDFQEGEEDMLWPPIIFCSATIPGAVRSGKQVAGQGEWTDSFSVSDVMGR